MDMIGFLGKKVDLVCNDGKQFSGYVFDVSEWPGRIKMRGWQMSQLRKR